MMGTGNRDISIGWIKIIKDMYCKMQWQSSSKFPGTICLLLLPYCFM